ncbi:hypothetical protein [Ralstonia phage RSP15]|uniref:hypothetical protein n=1 Tax=Ralstonia phage RSP15 TaxID=1785960 RepID=UPI00074D43E5|nr:hypothetical protein BH754_gp235 [Ralstonia phage RSP15]BAU40071.1 hypothetical protein [Ralstonia phage RSP15]
MSNKRTWKTNTYGNTKCYDGNKTAFEIGCVSYAERWAMAWCMGDMTREEAEDYALNHPELCDFTNMRK